tara:strand:+ start:18508 stop:20700 length:2193 start_codon:yes stop_codon:yes gene_type:complete
MAETPKNYKKLEKTGMTKSELIKLLEKHTKGTGLFPEALAAQMLHESGMLRTPRAKGGKGTSELSLGYNNYSGQKAVNLDKNGSGPNGKKVEGVDYTIQGTWEDFKTEKERDAYIKKEKGKKGNSSASKVEEIIDKNGNKTYRVMLGQPFTIFENHEEAVKGHIDFLKRNKRYSENGVFQAKNPEEQLALLKKSGYATSSDYVTSTVNILNDTIRVENPKYQITEEKKAENNKSVNDVFVSMGESQDTIPTMFTSEGQVAGYGWSAEDDDVTASVETTGEEDLNVAPEGETNIEKYIRLKRKANKNSKHDLTTGPSPFELTNEENQYLINVDDKDSPDYVSQKERITSDADLIVANDGDSSIIDAAEQDALEQASGFATGLSETITTDEGDVEVAAIPEGTTGKTKENIELEVDKRNTEANLKKAEEAKIKAEEADYIKKVKEGTATQEERDAAMKRHNDRLAGLMDEYKTEEDSDGVDTNQKDKDELRTKRMRNAEKVLSGLKAAAGVLSLSKALKDPEIDTPEISPLLMEAVDKQRQMAKSGMTAQEKSSAMQGLNNAYAGAMKNVLRASGGQRGMFLAGQGVVDANRINGLNQLAAQDAALHRQNIQQYSQLASSVGQMKLQADMSAEQMKQTALAQNRKTLTGIGSNLVSDALSDLSWYMNPNRDLIEGAQRDALEGLNNQGDNNKVDPEQYDYTVGGSNFRGSSTDQIKAQKAEIERLKKLNKPM